MEVAYRMIRFDGGEGEIAWAATVSGVLLKVCDGAQRGAPTLAVVSVKLLRVVDLPLDGLPTRAMRGSRGMSLILG